MTHEIQNFTFQNPTKILFGRNRIEDIDNEIPKALTARSNAPFFLTEPPP